MLNWIVLYGLLASFGFLAFNHNKVIAVANHAGAVQPVWLRGLHAAVYVIFICAALSDGLSPGPGYREWWNAYFDDHSTVLWLILVVLPTSAFWAVKSITFRTMSNPGHYDWFKRDMNIEPSLHKLDMRTPTILNTIFYLWILFSPWLPFYRCFVRGFVF
jgi:hypothetical protein